MLKKILTASFNTVYQIWIFLIHKCISWDKKFLFPSQILPLYCMNPSYTMSFVTLTLINKAQIKLF